MPVHGPSLTLSSVSARSAAGTGIRSVSFGVPAGSVHGILGENLSGASEVLAVIGGYLPIDDGELTIGGVPRRFANSAAAEAAGVRVIRGEPAIVPQTSVAENVHLGHEKTAGGFIRFGRMNANTAELLTRFGLGRSIDPAGSARGLSPAERHIVEFLRALVAGCTVVLLDEPFTGLDARGLDLVASGIRQLSAEGVTVVVSTHRLDLLRRIASNVTVLSRGAAVETVSLAGGGPSTARLVQHMTENIRITPRPQHEELAPGPVVFETRHFTAYDPVTASTAVVRDVSLIARRGEIVGLAGLEGSGVSELALSLFGRGFSSRVEGELLVNGAPLLATTAQESVAGGIGLSTSAEVRYDLNLIGGIPSRISSSMLARLAKLGLVDRDRTYKTSAPTFGLGGLSALMGRPAMGDGAHGAADSGWPAGGRRHLDALRAWLDLPLAGRPVVVILDHPTAALDPAQVTVVRDLILELAAGGTAVLLASDDLDELLVMTSRVYALVAGQVTAEIVTRDATPAALLSSMLG
ncbi:MAG: putative multiple sugar transport system ATP-binding protein [Subtercola sp.]|nr:putative multiple sugar transport system ATP-binding protein [Subtercola sp.]